MAFVKDGPWVEAAIVMGLLFVAVLLHEFGHCAGARLVDGDVQEVLLWPLGGLAAVDVPHTPRAYFVTAAAGPLMNLLLCLAAGCAPGYCFGPAALRPVVGALSLSPFGTQSRGASHPAC